MSYLFLKYSNFTVSKHITGKGLRLRKERYMLNWKSQKKIIITHAYKLKEENLLTIIIILYGIILVQPIKLLVY